MGKGQRKVFFQEETLLPSLQEAKRLLDELHRLFSGIFPVRRIAILSGMPSIFGSAVSRNFRGGN